MRGCTIRAAVITLRQGITLYAQDLVDGRGGAGCLGVGLVPRGAIAIDHHPDRGSVGQGFDFSLPTHHYLMFHGA